MRAQSSIVDLDSHAKAFANYLIGVLVRTARELALGVIC